MTDPHASDRDVSRAIRSWLHEDRHEDASRVAGAVLDHVEATPRRRATWWPARRTFDIMNKFVPLGLGAAAVVVALVVGMQFLPAAGGVGAAPSTSPSLTPAPTATLRPSPSPIAAPPLTQSFTSEVNGISLSYPEGWSARGATGPWTESTYTTRFDPPIPYIDYLIDPILGDHLFLNMASQPIGDATPEEWMVRQTSDCAATEPIQVDGATGLIGGEGCNVAVVTVGGRGYYIKLNASQDDPAAVAPYDRAWFEDVLATVRLHPEDAVDAGTTPAPAP